jgi:CRP-like cAMP-binding protein
MLARCEDHHSTLLLAGIACSYKQLEDGSRQIYSFQYPGEFCDLYRYVLPERDGAMAVQALTECLVTTIDYADIEQLLAQRPRLGLALWRTTMLEASILRERLSNARRGSALQRVANLSSWHDGGDRNDRFCRTHYTG